MISTVRTTCEVENPKSRQRPRRQPPDVSRPVSALQNRPAKKD